MTIRDDELRVNPFERRMLALNQERASLYKRYWFDTHGRRLDVASVDHSAWERAEQALFLRYGVVDRRVYDAWDKARVRALIATRRRLNWSRN